MEIKRVVKVTLANNFHHTARSVDLTQMDNGDYRITAEAARKARHDLCPYTSCTCGDTFGSRPAQLVVIAMTDHDWTVALP